MRIWRVVLLVVLVVAGIGYIEHHHSAVSPPSDVTACHALSALYNDYHSTGHVSETLFDRFIVDAATGSQKLQQEEALLQGDENNHDVAALGAEINQIHANCQTVGNRALASGGSHTGRVTTMEYLVTMTTHVPDGTSDEAVEEVRTREAAHSRARRTRTPAPPLAPAAAARGVALPRTLRC